ncbi:hypothetical protein M3Y97_00403000 [Aphelenchoides bicaudatus]|nr:hypothetical protein M3Y97_00403000 [Aphelenchoides bicaudatus]
MGKPLNGWLRFSRLDGHRGLTDSSSHNIDPHNLFGENDDADADFGALIPVMHHSSRSTMASPQPSSHYGLVGTRSLGGARSCPATPQMQRKLSEKDGATQLTSLTTLLTHHRHLFLFRNFLVIAKEKSGKHFKFKEKVPLNRMWICSNNCTHSFLIGWPVCNFVAHFNCEREKNEWFDMLSEFMNRDFRIHSTTISVAVKLDGMQQNIRKEIQNGARSSELLAELITELDLPPDPQLYELCFETSTMGTHATHGIENLYAIFMEHIARLGLKLSDSQLAHLDTCPLVNCRLILRSAQHGVRNQSTAVNLVHQFRKALISRMESKRLFGRVLEGSMPPQPVLTMIDHLAMNGVHVEGLFRKSPKQTTVRELRAQLDQGHVPDFHQYNVHVTASLLKDYLRSIPGQLLLSINFHQWIKVCDEADPTRRLRICRNLLRMLPPSHTVLLKSVLRLMRKIAATQQSKMTIRSLAVCIAPNLLENPHTDMVDSVKKIPELAIFLIENAHELFDHFEEDGPLFPPASNNTQLHQSTDSGLSDGVIDEVPTTNSPDSFHSSSPPLSDSVVDNNSDYKTTPSIEELKPETILPSDNKHPAIHSYQSAFSPRSHTEETTNNNDFSWSPSALVTKRLNRHGGFPSVMSSSSQSSPQRSPEPVRVHRSLANSAMQTERSRQPYALTSDDFNHRKKESTDSTKTLVARSDSTNSARRLMSPPAVSTHEPRSTFLTRPPLMTSPRSTARRTLLSKNETLGLPAPTNSQRFVSSLNFHTASVAKRTTCFAELSTSHAGTTTTN